MSLPTTKRLVLFSSFFTASQIPSYILIYLKKLRKFSTKLVYICTDDVVLSPKEQEQLYQWADDIIQVPNGGFDFGMWQKILPRYDWSEYEELCLVNDSCVCFNELDGFFEWQKLQTASITSIGSSREHAYHLQSYFLNIRQDAMADVVAFISRLHTEVSDIMDIVTNGEIGLSQYLLQRGYTLKAWFECDDNPTLFYITSMIRSGVPLVKKKAIMRIFREVVLNVASGTDVMPFYQLLADIRQRSDLSAEEYLQLFDFIDLYRIQTPLIIGR